MQTDLTSGAHHGRTGPLYVWSVSMSKRTRRNGLDLRATQPPAAAAQACPAVGGAFRGDDAPWAAGRQKYRWPTGLGLGCHVVCALGGVDAGEAPQRTRHGVVSGRECRGAGVHWAPRRPQPADSGPLQRCPGVHRPRQGRRRGDQCADSQGCPGLWLCRYPYPLVRHHGSGVAHRLSQRTGHCAGCGAALWQSLSEAHKAWGGRGRQGARTGTDDPQIGQRTPSLCQEQGRKASGVDTPSDGGRSVDRTNPSHGGATCAEPRSCDPKCHGDAWGHARGSQAAHTADRGGYAAATLRALANAGVNEIGIQPKGKGAWRVAEAVRETVRSERGKTEGIIGTLKTDKYGFNKPKERLWQTLEMAGPRSILSCNLNKLMRDLVRADR